MESSSCTAAHRHTWQAGRQAGGSGAAQHNHTACGHNCGSRECLLPGHVALLGLAVNAVVEGENSKSHSKFKMLHCSLSNARSLNDEYQPWCSLLCPWCITKEKISQPLCAAAHLWLCHYTIVCLSTMCWCWHTKKCTLRHSSLQVPDSWEEDGAKDGAAPWDQLWRFKFQGQGGPKGSRRWIWTLLTLF